MKRRQLPRAIMEILAREPIRNASLLNFARDYPVLSVETAGESVLVRGVSDHVWTFISSASREEFKALAARLTGADEYFAMLEDWMLPDLAAGHEILMRLTCLKLYLPDQTAIPPPALKEIAPLNTEDAQYIYENAKYQAYTDIAYIADRIERGPALGLRREGRLIAWLLTHDDGAMGFLHVLEDHRGRGLGRELTLAMIREIRALGQLPFMQIEEENAASLGLARKLGFVTDRRVSWLQRRGAGGG